MVVVVVVVTTTTMMMRRRNEAQIISWRTASALALYVLSAPSS
jgi:hypothetical protein